MASYITCHDIAVESAFSRRLSRVTDEGADGNGKKRKGVDGGRTHHESEHERRGERVALGRAHLALGRRREERPEVAIIVVVVVAGVVVVRPRRPRLGLEQALELGEVRLLGGEPH